MTRSFCLLAVCGLSLLGAKHWMAAGQASAKIKATDLIDSSFRTIASGTPEQRSKAMSQLADWLAKGGRERIMAVSAYRSTPKLATDGRAESVWNREHCKTLRIALPLLIEMLQTEQRNQVQSILFCYLCPCCPAGAEYTSWLGWWQGEGHRYYDEWIGDK